MSKQLAISAAFSVFMMASYALLGADSTREPFSLDRAAVAASPVEISAPDIPDAGALLPLLR